jgi:hypothetical protein
VFDKVTAQSTHAATAASGYKSLPPRLTNEELAHELMIDPTFKVDEHGGVCDDTPAHTKIREAFHAAFWKSLEDDLLLRPRPEYKRVLKILGEIRDMAADLATGGGGQWGGAGQLAGAGIISSVLDLDLIQSQINADAFEWACCVRLVTDVMTVLLQFAAIGGQAATASPSRNVCGSTVAKPACSPATATPTSPDSATVPATGHNTLEKMTWPQIQTLLAGAADNATQQPHAFCTALCFMLDYVKALRITVANARLRIIAPVVQGRSGVEYVQGKVDMRQKEVEARGDGSWLLRTHAWLRACVLSSCVSCSVNIDDLTTNDHRKGQAYKTVLFEGFVSLVTTVDAFKPEELAETLWLDKRRFAQLHAGFRSQVSIGCVLLVVQEYLISKKAPSVQQLLNNVHKSIGCALEREPDGTLATIVDAVKAALERFSTLDDSERNNLCTQLGKKMLPAGDVSRIMSGRLRALLKRALNDPGIFQDIDTIKAVFKELNMPRVVVLLLPKMRATSNLLGRVLDLHMSEYSPRYNDMIPVEAAAMRPTVVEALRWAC